MNPCTRKHRRIAGFTLIEVMITVAVVAILAAVALPNYIEYLTRSKLVEAKTNLSDMRTRLEQYFLDNRAYPAAPANCILAGPGPAGPGNIYLPASAKYFTVTCSTMTAAAYTISAAGLGFTFTIDQANARKTTAAPAGWATSAVCWVSKKNGDC